MLLPLLGLAACDDDEPKLTRDPGGPPICVVTSWPLHGIARTLAGDSMKVVCLLPSGKDVRSYQPDRDRLRELAVADLVVAQGAGLESWLARANISRDRRVVAAESFWSSYIESDESITHRHGNGEEHTHTGTDPHVWFDPRLFALMVRSVADGLIKVQPAEREAIEARAVAMLDDLDRIGERFDALKQRAAGKRVLSTHPTWRYLARRLDLELVDVDPTPEAVRAQLDGATCIFVERYEESLYGAGFGVPIVLLRPYVQLGEGEPVFDVTGWFEVLVERLDQVFSA